jgi:ABC-type molybdate transport system ATPase subunit
VRVDGKTLRQIGGTSSFVSLGWISASRPGKRRRLSAGQGAVAVRVRLGTDTELVAELTESTRSSLELELNKSVFLVVKTRSFSVLA